MTTQKVKNERPRPSANLASSATPKLERTTFRTSREMDFFSRKELVTQTGHRVNEWPRVFLKEAIDNALDACEIAGIAPVIEVVADPCGIEVRDNGVGLPESTLRDALNFTIRASDKEAYVSPCRGAQGNALKTLIPMPCVLDPDAGRFIVEAHGTRHAIRCSADPISQRAVVHDDTSTITSVPGTMVRMEWADRTVDDMPKWPLESSQPAGIWFDGKPTNIAWQCWSMVHGFAVLNPHATIRIDWFGKVEEWPATNTGWEKWRPDKPTSPHWYEVPHLQRLVAAYVTHGRDTGTDRLVNEFLAEFDGLSGSAKRGRVLADAGLKRAHLSELVDGNRLNSDLIERLLRAMQAHTRPVKSQRLGLIGADHFRARFEAIGIVPESFQYAKLLAKDGTPSVIETAFGYRLKEGAPRRLFAGANWSMALGNPFREFGDTGEGLESVLADQRAGSGQPIVFAIHLAAPRLEWKDRGKSSLVVED